MACDSLGSPEPETLWYKNGAPLKKELVAKNKAQADDEDNKLVMKISSVSEAGNYACKAKNLVGESNSLEFSLEVEQPQYGQNKNNILQQQMGKKG